MKKICFMLPTVFNIGGEQRVISSLSSALVERGYEVVLLLFTNKYEENFDLYDLNPQVEIVYVKGYQSFLCRLSRKFRNLNSNYGFLRYLPGVNKLLIKKSFPYTRVKQILKKINPDILIGVASDFNLLCALLAPDFSCMTIATQHSCYDAYFNTKGRRHYYEKKLFRKLMQNINYYVVLTDHDKEKIEKDLQMLATRIYNIQSFVSDKRADLSKKQMIAAGRFDKVKGFDLLIAAFNIFYQKNQDWKLKIFGDGKERNNLMTQIEKYGLEDVIELPGYSTNLIQHFCESSIYILSSRWEGFPMVLGECMEVGLPIISFDIDVMQEFITSGKNGILVDKFDTTKLAFAMDQLANDLDLRERISEAGRIKVKELSKEKIVDEWEKLFREMK